MAKKSEAKQQVNYSKNCKNAGSKVYENVYFCSKIQTGCHSAVNCKYYKFKS